MKIYYSLISIIILLSSFSRGITQNTVIHSISELKISQHIDFLASDELKGRGIGSAELTIASSYIQKSLTEIEMAAPPSGYLQPFTLNEITVDKTNSIVTISNKKDRQKKQLTNFIALDQAKDTFSIDGELIFGGFGTEFISQSESTQPIPDIAGKIVIYSAGSPQQYKEGTSGTWDASLEDDKITALFQSGARALLLITSPADSENTIYRHFANRSERKRYSIDNHQHDDGKPIYIGSPEIAQQLTRGSFRWTNALDRVAKSSDDQWPKIKDNQINIQSVLKREVISASNIIGYIEGSDSLLKHEYVVFMSHYDHLGTDQNGEIFNGADDNASGVAAILETARLFSQQQNRPKRSIVFLFPSAEEVGLLGSDYYSRNPVFPLENTIACINLDMVGRVYEPRDSVWADSPKPAKGIDGIYVLTNNFNPTLKSIADKALQQLNLKPDYSLPDRFFYSSDHYHFHKNQIPVLNFSTGYSADYHKVTDTPDRINTDKIKRVIQLCYLVGMELGNKE